MLSAGASFLGRRLLLKEELNHFVSGVKMAQSSVGVGIGYMHPLPAVPAGLNTLYQACRALYTDQQNPLQVVAVRKYWMGGPDPLDYISMYSNVGDPSQGIPPHWHYVSFGLSDLHGDGRVHDFTGPGSPSGFGFELTFRLRKEEGDTAPPTWPAAVMQGLARYVIQSDNILCNGDHVSWHCPLDNSESRIQHMLMTVDAQLGTVETPCGSVQFMQLVGVCQEELKAAQHWNGKSFLQLMKGVPGLGGPWLVTNMRRGESVFELEVDVEEAVQMGISQEGSDLSGVGAKMFWSEEMSGQIGHVSDCPGVTERNADCASPVGERGIGRDVASGVGGLHKDPCEEQCLEEGMPPPIRRLKALHLHINLEAGLLLPLMLKGRLKHGRHFTYKSAHDSNALTFVVPSVQGSFVTEEAPFGVEGQWCQALIQEDLLEDMIDDLDHLTKDDPEMLTLPKTYNFPHHNLSITLLPEDDY
ncbi:suppressor of fused homolog [Varroa destructor]|uniref:Suppressor of fused homolog n=1 Tax=Varroa destructor TaxID=109461 RepID=A0A7M7KJ35_VARDE|nr:suppressor of fused homolog [Varroa destructor]